MFWFVGCHIWNTDQINEEHRTCRSPGSICRWRTALIVRELEDEVRAFAKGQELRKRLKELLRKKEIVGDLCDQLRAGHTRYLHQRCPGLEHFKDDKLLTVELSELLMVMARLDAVIGPLVQQDGEHFSKRWGYLSITGVLLPCRLSCCAVLRLCCASYLAQKWFHRESAVQECL